MTPFLKQIAEFFYSKEQNKISDMVFVFPNRRSGIFFQKYLAIVAGKPLFSPTILTINEIFGKLSSYQLIDHTSLLFRLYKIYGQTTGSNESFDDFIFWGEMLLNDFDDVDKYLVDAKKLFTNVTDLKKIDEEFAYLEESQVEIIRRFWEHFIPSYETEKKENFAKTWEMLYEIYDKLRVSLKNEGLAYEGMMFRDVVENLENLKDETIPYKKIIFVGLNALTEAERALMRELKKKDIADFYWDYNFDLILDKDNKSSFFAQKNLNEFPSSHNFEVKKFSQPEIEVIGIPSGVGQTKQAYSIISDLIKSGDIADTHHAINTAVVLPDENLLLPMLYTIPSQIDPINVTMGYGLKNTPIFGLMEHIFELQKNVKFENGKPLFYHRSVEAILNHRYISFFNQQENMNILQDIKRLNKVYVPLEDLAKNEFLEKIFQPIKNVGDASKYLLSLLEYLQKGIEVEAESAKENTLFGEDAAFDNINLKEENSIVELTEIEKEFIYHYYITINRLDDVLKQNFSDFSIYTYFRLVKKLTSTISIPFRGEPLSGLQIMGVLETRALDFDNLIILSMNEGVFPLKKAANSFIPFNIRKGFGLSTTEHQDAVYAYHFYRMIMRAKKVFLIYDTRDSGLQTGEVSRFIYQLKYHYQIPIQEKVVTFDINLPEPVSIEVEKNEYIMKKLNRYIFDENRSLSPSSINSYLNCPMQFYFQHVEDLKEEDEVSEVMQTNTFGNIYHSIMESIYKRCVGQIVTADILKNVLKDKNYLSELINYAFAKHYFKTKEIKELKGFNFLIGEIMKKYIVKTLKKDISYTPFLYVGSEVKFQSTVKISDNRDVKIKGSIDRVDEKDGVVRVIDYKTGSGLNEFSSIAQLFDKEEKDRPKNVFQVNLYSMVYNQKYKPKSISPNIFYMRALFKDDNETRVVYKPKRNDEVKYIPGPVDDYMKFEEEFKAELEKCVEEIFNKEIPFTQTKNEKNCKYCDFVSLCKR
ncbi:MAG: PD-(D/E)XK nuclease family protein [Bacteroidales bacterium]|nr:PD-(D/E)XK nuclease family protein [Bacteroidales bacterium]